MKRLALVFSVLVLAACGEARVITPPDTVVECRHVNGREAFTYRAGDAKVEQVITGGFRITLVDSERRERVITMDTAGEWGCLHVPVEHRVVK